MVLALLVPVVSVLALSCTVAPAPPESAPIDWLMANSSVAPELIFTVDPDPSALTPVATNVPFWTSVFPL